MTNEIKEILFLLHNDRLTESGKRKLEDYITNLQEENERLKDYLKIMEKGKDNNLYRFLDYKQRIDTALDYIYLNFSNEDGSIWHQDFKIIKDILRGDE